MLHVDDLVSFISKAIEVQKTPFELYNVGSGRTISVKDLAKKIIELSGKHISIVHDLGKPTISTSLALDCGKASREIGWKPQIDLDEGILRTLTWYRKHLSCIL